MRIFKIECTANCDRVQWESRSGNVYKSFKHDYFVFQGAEDLSFNYPSTFAETRFGLHVIINDIRADKDEIKSKVIEACREWDRETVVKVDNIYETTFAKSFYCSDSRTGIINDFKNTWGTQELVTLLKQRYLISEFIPDSYSEEETRTSIEKTRFKNALNEELSRINREMDRLFEQNAYDENGLLYGAKHIPIHYLLQNSDSHETQSIMDILIQKLHQAGKVASLRATILNIDQIPLNNFSKYDFENVLCSLNDSFMHSLYDTTLIIKYGQFDNGETYDDLSYRAFSKAIKSLERHIDRIQVIFVLKGNNQNIKRTIINSLHAPFIELSMDETVDISRYSIDKLSRTVEEEARVRNLEPDEALQRIIKSRFENNEIDSIDSILNQWQRFSRLDNTYLEYRDSILNLPLHESNFSQKSSMTRLQELVGLKTVKNHILNLLNRIDMNIELSRNGIEQIGFSRHMAFLGSPGTGKTEVAKLFAQIMCEKGILKEGRLITVSGANGFDVDRAFSLAKGSVLFIDEAYGLTYMPSVVTSLIAKMESQRDETIVILAGYKKEMEKLIESNPGFRSRIGTIIDFPDYTNDEKLAIFEHMVSNAGLILEDGALELVRNTLERAGHKDDEGNARFIRGLFEDICGKQQIRLADNRPRNGYTREALSIIKAEDIETKRQSTSISARDKLEELIGLDEVKEIISDHLDYLVVRKEKRELGIVAPFLPMHMAFSGNPGTGKTEVARLIGQILKEEDILSVGDFYECGRHDLIGTAVGTTAPKIASLFKKAKGSVIFIDEAYSLIDSNNAGYGAEAISTIIDQMEKLREDVVVIFAGYKDELKQLFASNPGFKSRIQLQINFPDYSLNELVDIMDLMAKKHGAQITVAARKEVERIIKQALSNESFGNARYVRNLFEKALIEQGKRLVSTAKKRSVSIKELNRKTLSSITASDFKNAKTESSNKSIESIGFLAA